MSNMNDIFVFVNKVVQIIIKNALSEAYSAMAGCVSKWVKISNN